MMARASRRLRDLRKVGPVVVLLGISTLLVLGIGLRRGSADGPDRRPTSAGGGGASPVTVPDSADVAADSAAPSDGSLEHKLEELTERVRREPWELEQLLELARLLDESQRPIQAAEEYERYLAARPHSRSVWLLLANAYATTGNWSQAADASHRLLRRFPEDPWAMYNLGAALANQGRYEDARGWWERVLEGDDSAMTRRALTALDRLAGFQDR